MKKKKIKATPANEKYVVDIITDYDAISDRCDEFDIRKGGSEVQDIIVKLKNTIRKNNLNGLSANQIGFDKRILCLNFNNDIRTFINPIITGVEGYELSRETCSSIPGKTFIRIRNSRVWVTYQTPLGKIESVELNGFASRIMQHHIDHLDGMLLSDVGLEIFDDFDSATEEERMEVIEMYLDSLDMTAKDIEEDLDSTEDGKQLHDAVRFMESVRKGETVIESRPMSDDEIEELKKKMHEAIESNRNGEVTDNE